MIKINWSMEEAVVLIDFYLHNDTPSKNDLTILRQLYLNRANILNIVHDDKFRNESGLSMQLGVIKNLFTNGKEGFSNRAKIFDSAFSLYNTDIIKFNKIVSEFYKKYSK